VSGIKPETGIYFFFEILEIYKYNGVSIHIELEFGKGVSYHNKSV